MKIVPNVPSLACTARVPPFMDRLDPVRKTPLLNATPLVPLAESVPEPSNVRAPAPAATLIAPPFPEVALALIEEKLVNVIPPEPVFEIKIEPPSPLVAPP